LVFPLSGAEFRVFGAECLDFLLFGAVFGVFGADFGLFAKMKPEYPCQNGL